MGTLPRGVASFLIHGNMRARPPQGNHQVLDPHWNWILHSATGTASEWVPTPWSFQGSRSSSEWIPASWSFQVLDPHWDGFPPLGAAGFSWTHLGTSCSLWFFSLRHLLGPAPLSSSPLPQFLILKIQSFRCESSKLSPPGCPWAPPAPWPPMSLLDFSGCPRRTNQGRSALSSKPEGWHQWFLSFPLHPCTMVICGGTQTGHLNLGALPPVPPSP